MTAVDTVPTRGGWRQTAAAVWRSTSATVGLLISGIFIVLAILAPFIAPADPLELSSQRLMAPTAAHIMGTDDLGRDVLSRVLYGARVSLVVGGTSALIATVIGGAVGIVSGYFGGLIDDITMRITEFFQVIPKFLLAIVVVAIFGGGLLNIILVIGILSWPNVARVVRSQALVLRREEFVLGAIMGGASTSRVLLKHVLPNVLPFVIVAGSLQTGQAILIESFLSFLGLGDPLNPSWGLLLQQAQLYLASAWWMSVFPGIALTLSIVGLNLAGDGVGEVVNPRQRHVDVG